MLEGVICEKDPVMMSYLQDVCQGIEGLKIIGVVTSGGQLLKLIEIGKPGVILLDTRISNNNGVKIAREIKYRYPGIKVILFAHHDYYCRDAFEVFAYDYILKSDIKERLPETISMLQKEILAVKAMLATGNNDDSEKRQLQWIGINVNRKKRYIFPEDIIFIKSIKRKLKIVSKNKEYQVYGKIKDWVNKLGDGFFRCHRSYIINLKEINSISRNNHKLVVRLRDRKELIPISRKRYQELREKINLK